MKNRNYSKIVPGIILTEDIHRHVISGGYANNSQSFSGIYGSIAIVELSISSALLATLRVNGEDRVSISTLEVYYR